MSATQQFDLDTTLRYIYSTFRNKKYTMAIEFKHNGRIWRCDTAEEAIELRQKLETDDDDTYASGGEPAVAKPDWTPDAVTDLLKGSGDLQKKFLRYLYEHDKAVTSAEIVKALKLHSEEAFAGVLSGLSKRLKKTELQPGDLYSVTVQWTTTGKVRRFKLASGFRWTAMQLGWPETWI
jgi:hypothetical protein